LINLILYSISFISFYIIFHRLGLSRWKVKNRVSLIVYFFVAFIAALGFLGIVKSILRCINASERFDNIFNGFLWGGVVGTWTGVLKHMKN